MNICSLQAVVRTNGEVHIFNLHGENLLLFIVVRLDKDVHILDRIRQIDKQIDMILHNLCGERYDLLSRERSVRPDFDRKSVIIDILTDTRGFNVVINFFTF